MMIYNSNLQFTKNPQIQNEVVVSVVIILEYAGRIYISELINKLSQREKCSFERDFSRYRTATDYVAIVQRRTTNVMHTLHIGKEMWVHLR